MWVVGDEDGFLFAYRRKPYKSVNHLGTWNCSSECVTLPEEWFPEVKWEDEEPRELILK